MAASRTVRIATRESQLALAQTRMVAAALAERHAGLTVELVPMTTKGDRVLDRPLAQVGGKGLFVKELEVAMDEGRADLAVHSMKDVPMALPPQFALATFGEREVALDALVSNRHDSLGALAPGARVGTSSLRRECQLRARHPRLRVEPLRGNVTTRLRKLDAGDCDAVILAAAGLKRLGLEDRITRLLPPTESLPAPGQGALGVECLSRRVDLVEALAALNHPATARCVAAERAFSRALSGNCNVPLGGYAEVEGRELRLRGFVGAPDGSRVVQGELRGPARDPEALGATLARALEAQGAAEILAQLQA